MVHGCLKPYVNGQWWPRGKLHGSLYGITSQIPSRFCWSFKTIFGCFYDGPNFTCLQILLQRAISGVVRVSRVRITIKFTLISKIKARNALLNFFNRSDRRDQPRNFRDNRDGSVQGHPATFFGKITVQRSTYRLEISKALQKLKISG